MSGHCPGCGEYCEEDDSRLCATCKHGDTMTTPPTTPAASEGPTKYDSQLEESAANLCVKAHRFLMLYAASEHDGESWGQPEAVRRRASELQDAIDDIRAVTGKPLLAEEGGLA